MVFSAFPVFSRRLAAVLAVAALAGCASMSGVPGGGRSRPRYRSWKARMANDLDRAYEFTAPFVSGASPLWLPTKRVSAARSSGTQRKWRRSSASPQDKCVAQMKVEAKPALGLGSRRTPPITTYFDETWIRENGQWWVFPTP